MEFKGKLFSDTIMNGVFVRRTPFTESEEKLGRFTPIKYFLPYEVSVYADVEFGEWGWGDVTTNDVEALKMLVMGTHPQYEDYICVFARWQGNKGKAILVHNSSGIQGLKDIGVLTHLKSLVEATKAAKYINRLFAPNEKGYVPVFGFEQEGSWIANTQECIIDLDNGEWLSVKYVNLDDATPDGKANCDGHIGLNDKAMRVLKLTNHPEIGDSFRVTCLTQRGFGKGHTLYQPNQEADIVIYDKKRHVSGSKFCFMSLGPIHAGNPHSDIQSVINFKLWNLLAVLAAQLMMFWRKEFHSIEGVKRVILQLLRMKDTRGDEDIEDEDPVDLSERFLLREVTKLGISFFSFPGIYRRAYRRLTEDFKPETWRVPLNACPEHAVATSKYMCGDPYARLADGTPDMTKSVILKGQICIMDLPAGIDVIIYRQPNENSNAFFKLKNIHHPRFKDAKGKPAAFLGHGSAEIMARLGGGDMDDNIIIIHDPVWVAHFEKLHYPELVKVDLSQVPTEEENDYVISLMDDAARQYDKPDLDVEQFGIDHMLNQIKLATGFDVVNIGTVVNPGMIDSVTSYPENKAAMLLDLKRRGFSVEVQERFANKPDYFLAILLTYLERIIDAQVKDPEEIQPLNAAIRVHTNGECVNVRALLKQFTKVSNVYPTCLAGKIPASIKETGKYILADSEMCRVQRSIAVGKQKFVQMFTKQEWKLAKKADPFIAGFYPANERIMRLVYGIGTLDAETGRMVYKGGLRKWWKAEWDSYHQAVAANSANVNEKIYSLICAKLTANLAKLSDDTIKAMAMELYRALYRNPNPEPVLDPVTGQAQNFRDGLLWTNVLATAFLTVLKENGLTGQIAQVKLFTEQHLANKPRVEVSIANGVVTALHGNVEIGLVNNKKFVGMKTMWNGMITFKNANYLLNPKDGALDDLEPLK